MIEGKRKCALQMQRAGNTFLAVIPLARPRGGVTITITGTTITVTVTFIAIAIVTGQCGSRRTLLVFLCHITHITPRPIADWRLSTAELGIGGDICPSHFHCTAQWAEL